MKQYFAKLDKKKTFEVLAVLGALASLIGLGLQFAQLLAK